MTDPAPLLNRADIEHDFYRRNGFSHHRQGLLWEAADASSNALSHERIDGVTGK